MRNDLVVIGALVLVAGIFGYTYAQDQQGLLEQGEDIVRGEQQNWGFIQAVSAAGIVGGIVLLIAGMIPETWRTGADDRDG